MVERQLCSVEVEQDMHLTGNPALISTCWVALSPDGKDDPICETAKETQMYRTDFWTLWGKARVG